MLLRSVFLDLFLTSEAITKVHFTHHPYPGSPVRVDGKSHLERGAGVCTPPLPAPRRRARPGTGGVGAGKHLI